MRARVLSLVVLLTAAAPATGFAQLSPSAKWATEAAAQYAVNANITYRTASNQQLKIDVYYRRGATTPQPTLVYMHGGFWVAGAKETAIAGLLPWLEMGWNVVNVEYPAGSRRRSHDTGAGCGGRLFLRPALRRRAAGQLQHRHKKDRRDRRVGRRASRLVDGHHPGKRGPGTGVRRRGISTPATPGRRRPRRRSGRRAGYGNPSRDASCHYQRSRRSSIGSASPTCRT